MWPQPAFFTPFLFQPSVTFTPRMPYRLWGWRKKQQTVGEDGMCLETNYPQSVSQKWESHQTWLRDSAVTLFIFKKGNWTGVILSPRQCQGPISQRVWSSQTPKIIRYIQNPSQLGDGFWKIDFSKTLRWVYSSQSFIYRWQSCHDSLVGAKSVSAMDWWFRKCVTDDRKHKR